jgi:hypothetical protein
MSRPKSTEDKAKKLQQIRAVKELLAANNEYSIWLFLPESSQVKLDSPE